MYTALQTVLKIFLMNQTPSVYFEPVIHLHRNYLTLDTGLLKSYSYSKKCK